MPCSGTATVTPLLYASTYTLTATSGSWTATKALIVTVSYPDIVYEVVGTVAPDAIWYRTASGALEELGSVRLPWSITLATGWHPDAFATVTASFHSRRNAEGGFLEVGCLTARVIRRGALAQSSTSCGPEIGVGAGATF